MVLLSLSEIRFLKDNECCRLATCVGNRPHVIPVNYVYKNDHIYISTDYDTRKFNDIKKNNGICLVIDQYLPGNNKGLVLDGNAFIIENGKKYLELYEVFYETFRWVRDDPWEEGAAPFLEIQLRSSTSWGLD